MHAALRAGQGPLPDLALGSGPGLGVGLRLGLERQLPQNPNPNPNPGPDPSKVHFQNKFCANCRSTVFLVPLARLRAVGAEQASHLVHHIVRHTVMHHTVHCTWTVYYIVL